MAENSFRHVTSGAYAKKGPVMRTSLFSGHWGLNPLGFGSMRVDKGYLEYHDKGAYDRASKPREAFAAAMKGNSLAKKASEACANVKSNKAACFVGHLTSMGKEML
jgi:hypothetical protein